MRACVCVIVRYAMLRSYQSVLLRLVCDKKIVKRHLVSAPTGGDAYTIQAVHSGKYLNVAGASRDNGADVLVRGV